MRVLVLAAMLAGGGCALDRSAPALDAEGASTAASGGGGHAGSGSPATSSGAGGAAGAGGTPWLDGFAARKRVTFEPPPLEAALADFPAAIILSADADLAAVALPDGADLAFTTDDAITPLSHEVERYDAATGELTAWVRLPLLAATGPTTVFLYYGGRAAEPPDAAGTWSPAFAGVWHLGEDERGPARLFRDSTTHANHGTAGRPAGPIPVDGIAGGAASFEAGATVTIGDPADDDLDFDTASFAYSLWVLVHANTGPYDMPWFKGGANQRMPGYDIELGSGGWYAWVNDGSPSGRAVSFGGEHFDEWTHLAVVVDRESGLLRSYVQGKPVATTDIADLGSLTTSIGATLGSAGYPFQGLVDEARVYAAGVGPGWVAAEHANLTSGSFVTVGPAEAL